ncbi:hypothetical protein MXB_239, partial [Myxobolus squamalis]
MVVRDMEDEVTYDPRLEPRTFIMQNEVQNNYHTAMDKILSTLIDTDKFNIYYVSVAIIKIKVLKNEKDTNTYLPVLVFQELVNATIENINAFKLGIRQIPEEVKNRPFYINVTEGLQFSIHKLQNAPCQNCYSIIMLFIGSCVGCDETINFLSKINFYGQYVIFCFNIDKIKNKYQHYINRICADNLGDTYDINT